MFLFGKADLEYGDIKVNSHVMENNFDSKVLKAYGGKDTSGKTFDSPVFYENNDTYEAKEIIYNFDTKKGMITKVITEAGTPDGIMHGDSTLKDEHNNVYIKTGRFTTCNLEHPHYYIETYRSKYTPKGTTIAQKAYFVIGDVPTPLFLPFFMFSSQSGRSSGFIVPQWGERNSRGFFLENGGYYWAVNDYIGSKFTGSIYTRGDWIVTNATNYKKKYRYSGNTSLQIRNQVENLGLYNEYDAYQYKVTWTHTPQAYNGKSFRANVNYVTNDFTRTNVAFTANTISNLNLRYATTFTSNINYNFPLKHTPYKVGMAVSLRQNILTGIGNMSAPQLNLTTNNIKPFKSVKGKRNALKDFIKTIGFNHTVDFSNQLTNTPTSSSGFSEFEVANFVSNTDTLDFVPSNFLTFWNNGKLKLTHTVPVSASMKIGSFQLNPIFNYVDRWYFEKYDYEYLSGDSVRVDTVNGFQRTGEWNTSVNLRTTLYGTYGIKAKNRNFIFRHVMQPSIGFSYNPDYSDGRAFVDVQNSDTTFAENISIFHGSASGVQSTTLSKSITFSLSNTLEMKFRDLSKDASSPDAYKKVKILDNLSLSGNYNLAADSLKLSNISLSARTTIGQGLLSLSSTSTINPYAYNNPDDSLNSATDQYRINKLAITEGQGIGFQNFRINASLKLDSETFKKKEASKQAPKAVVPNSDFYTTSDNLSDSLEVEDKKEKNAFKYDNEDLYVPFELPWSLSVNYYVNYSKVGFLDKVKTEGLDFNAKFDLTSKWSCNFRASYDFDTKQLLRPSIVITRDLHCWVMNFDWVPSGPYQSYNFQIGIKAAILNDMKIRKTNQFSAFRN